MSDIDDGDWLTRGSTNPAEVRTFYDEWAERYDADLAGWDYRAPDRIAHLLAERADLTAPVLDAGCGTGLSGRALRDAGFTGALTGVDLSEASLPVARESSAYDHLIAADLNERLAFEDDAFGTLASVGVLTYVPDVERCWRDWCRVVRPGGLIGFTQREDTWIERRCREVIDRLAADGEWSPLVITDPEAYLPSSDNDLAHIGAHYVVAEVV